MTQLLLRWAVLAVGVALATKLVPGIRCDDAVTLVVVVVLLSLFNAVLKPVLLLFTLPFIVLTMGLGIIVINALLFLLVGRLVDGFHVASFWSAIGGALIVSVTNLLLGGLTRSQPRRRDEPPPPPTNRGGRERGKSDDVIDI
ncbi:phage holin family protein [Opitutus terrae]|nr:phage holin family protein [Opitutus terrae]